LSSLLVVLLRKGVAYALIEHGKPLIERGFRDRERRTNFDGLTTCMDQQQPPSHRKFTDPARNVRTRSVLVLKNDAGDHAPAENMANHLWVARLDLLESLVQPLSEPTGAFEQPILKQGLKVGMTRHSSKRIGGVR